MPVVTLQLEEDLVKRVLEKVESETPALEASVMEAQKNVDIAQDQLNKAKERLSRNLLDIQQLKGGAIVSQQKKEEEVVATRFWKEERIVWKQYLPDFIEGQRKLISLSMIIKYLRSKHPDLSEAELKTLNSTISGSLSALKKEGKLNFYLNEGRPGAFYGLPSWFDENGQPKEEFTLQRPYEDIFKSSNSQSEDKELSDYETNESVENEQSA